MRQLRVLLVDDDDQFRGDFARHGSRNFDVVAVDNVEAARRALNSEPPDAALLDIHLTEGGGEGLELLAEIQQHHPTMPVVMVSADDCPDVYKSAMLGGATDFINKSPDLEVLNIKLQRALDHVAWTQFGQQLMSESRPPLIGSGSAMVALRKQIERLAGRRTPVLITGETGTGKELVAHALHQSGPRAGQRFVDLNAAGEPGDLFESRLFGHERGAFTGADQRRIGAYELADRGTLYLDEVAELPPERQVKLLRVLDGNPPTRVGGNQPLDCDVRWLFATHEEIEARVEEQKFRADLMYRIQGAVISVPPLRDRLEDLPELAEALLGRWAAEEREPRVPRLDRDAFSALAEHHWPGNVRELRYVLERAAIMAEADTLSADLLRHEIRPTARSGGTPSLESLLGDDLKSSVRRFETFFCQRALDRHDGVVSRAAQEIGITRQALGEKAKLLELRTRSTQPDGNGNQD